MPFYSLICKKKHQEDKLLTFEDYDLSAFGNCNRCGHELAPVAANSICVYGTIKYHDQGLRDASEAAGKTIRSAKEADQLESSGQMYRITNPSRHRTTADERKRERA